MSRALGLGVDGLTEVGQRVVQREPHVICCGDNTIRDHATLQAAHPVGQHHLGTPPSSAKYSPNMANVVADFSSAAKRTTRHRDHANTAQNT